MKKLLRKWFGKESEEDKREEWLAVTNKLIDEFCKKTGEDRRGIVPVDPRMYSFPGAQGKMLSMPPVSAAVYTFALSGFIVDMDDGVSLDLSATEISIGIMGLKNKGLLTKEVLIGLRDHNEVLRGIATHLLKELEDERQ